VEVAFEGELLPPELACGNAGMFGIFPGTADYSATFQQGN